MCQACALNRYIPNMNAPDQQEQWREFEQSKRRLVYSLLQLNLPIQSKTQSQGQGIGLSVDFIASNHAIPLDATENTGHADGQITVAASEADPVQREQNRVDLNEDYRTLLGHLRHEVGHYYWDILVKSDSSRLDAYRELFGDETQNYSEALNQHYRQGAPINWCQTYVSAYASAHPWEDWAETWAHYMHLMDLVETASSYGLSANPDVMPGMDALRFEKITDPYSGQDFHAMFNHAGAVAMALNSLNRSLGHRDAYPFVLTDAIKSKLLFVHDTIHGRG